MRLNFTSTPSCVVAFDSARMVLLFRFMPLVRFDLYSTRIPAFLLHKHLLTHQTGVLGGFLFKNMMETRSSKEKKREETLDLASCFHFWIDDTKEKLFLETHLSCAASLQMPATW